MGRSRKRELKDLQTISDYHHSTNYKGLEDTHLHMVEITEKSKSEINSTNRRRHFF